MAHSIGVLTFVLACFFMNQIYPLQNCTNVQDHRCVDLCVIGPVLLNDGIGKQAIDLLYGMRKKCTLSFISSTVSRKDSFLPHSLRRIVKNGKKYYGRVVVMEECVGDYAREDHIGPYWARFGLKEQDFDQIRLAYTMFESTRIPGSYTYCLNHFYDGAVVPDPSLVRVYRDSGVTIPIFVVPLGRDYSRFLKATLPKRPHVPFVFANYSTCLPRKNLLCLIEAFNKAFGNNPAAVLYLGMKISYLPYAKKVQEMISSHCIHNVILSWGPLSNEEYCRRFLKADCYVSISIGEGFSIGPREALALQMPAIVSDALAQKTICDTHLVRVVPAPFLVEAEYSFPGKNGFQFQCEVDEVAKAMMDVYKNYSFFARKAQKGRAYIRHCTVSAMAKQFIKLIKPKEIFIGDENRITKNGFMTENRAFAEKYARILHMKPIRQAGFLTKFVKKSPQILEKVR